MVAHAQYEIGNAARLVQEGRQSMRSTPVGAVGTQPVVVASSPNHDEPQHHAEQPRFLRPLEWTAKWHENGLRLPNIGVRSRACRSSAALLNMSNRRFFVFAAGITLLVGGLLALRFPVFLPNFDQWGFQINCGSGFPDRVDAAGIADSGAGQFIDECHTAVAIRRAWAIPVTMAGALLLSALAVILPSTRQAAGSPVPTNGAGDAEAFDGAIAPASGRPDASTALAPHAIPPCPAPAA